MIQSKDFTVIDDTTEEEEALAELEIGFGDVSLDEENEDGDT